MQFIPTYHSSNAQQIICPQRHNSIEIHVLSKSNVCKIKYLMYAINLYEANLLTLDT